jgi:hypothetical protein
MRDGSRQEWRVVAVIDETGFELDAFKMTGVGTSIIRTEPSIWFICIINTLQT